jgi:hypothetical protein
MNKHTIEYKVIASKVKTKKNEQTIKDVNIDFKEQLEIESNHELHNYPKRYSYTMYVAKYFKYRENLKNLKTKEFKTIDLDEELSKLDFDDATLYHTELIQEILKEYVEVFINKYTEELINLALNKLTRHLADCCKCDTIYLNRYMEYLFNKYEQQQAINAAEYLAVYLLDNHIYRLNQTCINLFEHYRKLAIGSFAPWIILSNSNSHYRAIHEISASHKILVFTASWSEDSSKELDLLQVYQKKLEMEYNSQIIMVSLDRKIKNYSQLIKKYKFITSCDGKDWESENIKNYNIYKLPTFFIIDNQNKIVAKPINTYEVIVFLNELNKINSFKNE